ncbi:hypothetical protein NA57DRAFT_77722 [Rhizodiscina lignyota]|uniref:DUF7820 domain-containing protein n=1 Tax=Rhizodiscina lignyota TaxID=1504668 RepID=A0A9P4M551_9PEZI|nr:hypothetical protein NA57DRAFT_77722 [Rhizodiscina lignyota]
MDRQRSENDLDRTVTARSDNPNVFDDEYAVDTPTSADFEVGNGFSTAAERGADSQPRRTSRNPSVRASSSIDAKVAPMPSRSSIQKPRDALGAPSPSTDRSSTPVSTPPANAVATPLADLPRRSSSRASSAYATTERASSPQQASGPSFPYSLYQQSSTGVGRSPSLATTSTARPSTLSSTAQRPTHPYALYSQNGLDEGAETPTVQQSIPLGFPGRADAFHRQIGPDGEEQDIVGPDGHTEQLPPYSRYPEEGAAKVAVTATAPSQETLSRDTTQTPLQTNPSSSASRTLIVEDGNNESGEVSEKTWHEKTWKERRRTKVCGGRLPCWIVTFMVVTAIIIVGLVAGLAGGLVAAEKKSNAQVVTTTLFDASPIAAPTGIPGPPAGTWALPLGIPEEQQNGCITDTSQQKAWTCSQYGPPLLFNISAAAGGQRVVGTAQLGDINPSNSGFNYGTQPPVMQVSALEWVVDLDDPHQGPALHFQAMYDKVVIVSENDFDPDDSPSRLLRRGGGNNGLSFGPGDEFHNKKGKVNNGDQPWLCYWNQTFIEGFIYMEQNSSDAASQSSAFASYTSKASAHSAAVASSASTTPSSTSPSMNAFIPPSGWSHFTPPASMPSSDWASWYSSLSEASASSSSSAAAAEANADAGADASADASASAGGYRKRSEDHDSQSAITIPTTTTPAPSVYTIAMSGSGTISSTSFTVPTFIPLFPHIVKIEERRMGMSDNKAVCTQMQLEPGNQLVPVLGPDNGQITITLSESDPSDSDFEQDKDEEGQSKRRAMTRRRYRRMWDRQVVGYDVQLRRRDNEPVDSCHCQWKNT